MRESVKVDAWILGLFILPIVVMLLPLWLEESDSYGVILAFIIPYTVFVVWVVKGSSYVLDDEYLLIKMLFIRQKIRYESIESVQLTRNLYSSMALSASRIEIKEKNKGFFRGTTYISPNNREAFYEALKMNIAKHQKKSINLDWN